MRCLDHGGYQGIPYIATTTKTDKNGKETLISIADGRSYLPVDEHKGYIGTSNGIYVFDNDNLTIGGQIKGTGNPNDEGYGQLYYAQIGTMYVPMIIFLPYTSNTGFW